MEQVMTADEAEQFSLALSFAAKKHAHQQRKNGSPYILHPLRVSGILADAGYGVRYQIVGLFHDLLEDTDATEEDLSRFCDAEMLRAVRLVTKAPGYVEADYISAILASPMAKAVKNADRLDNLAELPHSGSRAFQHKYMVETRDYFYRRFSPELDALYESLLAELGESVLDA